MTLYILLDITRYLAYGWGWRTIVRLINLEYGTSYSAGMLKQAYEDTLVDLLKQAYEETLADLGINED